MRLKLAGATALAALLASGSAYAEQTTITVWSWNIAASALKSTVEGFNKKYPDIKVDIQDMGNPQIYDKLLAACAAGGDGLPDITSIENHKGAIFWSRFPDCMTDLTKLGYNDELKKKFPDFKRTELEVGDAAYGMPWDSGPVTMFYRRDLYEKAGVDPATIKTWDDFIAAGKKISAANPGVVMAQADLNGEADWFRMLANEQSCGYFSDDGQSITVNKPACIKALEKVKEIKDAGLLTAANWNEKIQSNKAGKVASQLYGGWYEGTIRSTAPELSGKWGVYPMPSLTADGAHAANLGGSALSIASSSKHKEAAWKFVEYTLGTNEGQVTMLKSFGLVPSLLSAVQDPFVNEAQPYWGGQKIWADILSTLPRIHPSPGTQYFNDADAVVKTVQTKFLAGGYPNGKAALDDAAQQIASATGLPIAQ